VDLIFTNEAGDMIRRSNFGTMWRRVTKSVELEGLHFHDLRHYYASLLIRHGESVKTATLVRPWICSWLVFLRTPCGLAALAEGIVAGQNHKSG
jgi:hypothetical protein